MSYFVKGEANGIYKIEVRERAIVLVVMLLWPFGDG